MPDKILLQDKTEHVLVLTFNHEKSQNPFSDTLQDALMEALKNAAADEQVHAVVLYGGHNRSFSVGGDFKEAIALGKPESIGKALSKVVDLYIAILTLNKPIIAAIDNYAIGMGFQIALLADYRITTQQTTFLMPELKNGVACTLGSVMTEFLFGRFIMQEICYEGNKLTIDYCQNLKLINEITLKENLLQRAIEKAKQYGSFPHKAFRGTKQVNNLRFINCIENSREDTIKVHIEVFTNKEHQQHMTKILGKN